MIHFYCAELDRVLIRPLHMYDIEYLREWRNRDDLSTYLSKRDTISKEAQEKWYGDYLNNEDIIFFCAGFHAPVSSCTSAESSSVLFSGGRDASGSADSGSESFSSEEASAPGDFLVPCVI